MIQSNMISVVISGPVFESKNSSGGGILQELVRKYEKCFQTQN